MARSTRGARANAARLAPGQSAHTAPDASCPAAPRSQDPATMQLTIVSAVDDRVFSIEVGQRRPAARRRGVEHASQRPLSAQPHPARSCPPHLEKLLPHPRCAEPTACESPRSTPRRPWRRSRRFSRPTAASPRPRSRWGLRPPRARARAGGRVTTHLPGDGDGGRGHRPLSRRGTDGG